MSRPYGLVKPRRGKNVTAVSFDAEGNVDLAWHQKRGWRGAMAKVPSFKAAVHVDGEIYHWVERNRTVLEKQRFSVTYRMWGMFEARGIQTAILGMHLYVTTRRDGLVLCEAVLSNAAVRADNLESFCGAVWYEWLGVQTEGFSVELDYKRHGTSSYSDGMIALVAPGRHYFPAQAATLRRWVAHPDGKKAEARALLDLEDMEIPATIENFTGSKARAESDPFNANDEAYLFKLKRALHFGTSDFAVDLRHNPWGPFHPPGNLGISYEHGGQGIEPLPVAGINRNGIIARRISADLDIERAMGILAFNKETGQPIPARAWAFSGAQQNFEHRLERAPRLHHLAAYPHFTTVTQDAGNRDLYAGWKQYNEPNGCPYQDELDKIVAHDDAHFARATRNLVASWYLNKPFAWAHREVHHSMCEDMAVAWTMWGKPANINWMPHSLSLHHSENSNMPGQGGTFYNLAYGRKGAWVAAAVADMKAMGTWSRDWDGWATKFLQNAMLATNAATGVTLNAERWEYGAGDDVGFNQAHSYAQTFEACFFAYGLAKLWMMTRKVNIIPTVLRCADSLFFNTNLLVNRHYVETGNPDPVDEIKVNLNYPGIPEQGWWWGCILAICHRITLNQKYLNRMLGLGQRADSFTEKADALQANPRWAQAEGEALCELREWS